MYSSLDLGIWCHMASSNLTTPSTRKLQILNFLDCQNSSSPRPYGHVIFSGNSAICKGQLLFLFPFPFWYVVFSGILLVYSPCFVCFLFIKCRTCTRGHWTAVTWPFLINEIRRSKCLWIGRHENWILSKTLIWHNSSVLCTLSCVLVPWLQLPAQPVKKLKMAFEQHSVARSSIIWHRIWYFLSFRHFWTIHFRCLDFSVNSKDNELSLRCPTFLNW